MKRLEAFDAVMNGELRVGVEVLIDSDIRKALNLSSGPKVVEKVICGRYQDEPRSFYGEPYVSVVVEGKVVDSYLVTDIIDIEGEEERFRCGSTNHEMIEYMHNLLEIVTKIRTATIKMIADETQQTIEDVSDLIIAAMDKEIYDIKKEIAYRHIEHLVGKNAIDYFKFTTELTPVELDEAIKSILFEREVYFDGAISNFIRRSEKRRRLRVNRIGELAEEIFDDRIFDAAPEATNSAFKK